MTRDQLLALLALLREARVCVKDCKYGCDCLLARIDAALQGYGKQQAHEGI